MNKSGTSRTLQVNYAGPAIEYGTFTLLIESLNYQPVLVMPLEHSFHSGGVSLSRYAIHVTTRLDDMNSPIAYATFLAAEIKRSAIGATMNFPSQEWVEHPQNHAQHLQQQLQTCVIDRLKESAYVSQIIVPARHRLPDEWIWSARATDEQIAFRDGAWTLLDKGESHV